MMRVVAATDTLVWNSRARSSSGTALFPNGTYRILIRSSLDTAVVESSSLQLTVNNR